MVKLFGGIYLHFLTPLLFILCYMTGTAKTFFVTYLIMLVHELAHFCAALSIGLRPSHIVFYPFGVNLRLKNKIVPTLSDEIILYGAGPLANILMAFLAKLFFRNFSWYEDFYLKNIILCILNLMPIMPMDGGIIARKFLSFFLGYKKSMIFMRIASAFFVLLFFLFFYTQNILKHNFSAWFFLIFLSGNLFTTKEKYNLDILKEFMFEKHRKTSNRCRIFALEKGENPHNLLKYFTNNRRNIVLIIGENGEIEKIMSEREVIGSLLAN